MSMELLRLGLQFFAGETKEEEDEVIIPGEEGVTGASGVAGNTPPVYIMPQNTVAAPEAQDFDTWYKANGGMDEAGYYAKYDLDPERDYQNTVNTLNYEYQTSMATYGENAEKMYQMGLQNSGVSDIFQANAFSAYLGNMNQAAADRITARRKNKAAFNDYVAGMRAQHGQYETGIKTEYDTKLNSALTYALSKYNGYNLQDVLNQLAVSGYYTDIVDEIGKRLSGMDSTTLKAETEGALAQSIINSISGFTGSDADKVAAKSMFGGMFPDDVIEAAFGRAQAIYNNSPEAADATVQSWVDTLYGSFTGNEVDFDDWDNYQLADVPENLRVKIKEAIRQQFDSRVNTIYDAIVAEYSPDQKEGIRSYYTQKGYSKYEIDAAISAAEDFYNKNPNTQAETVKGVIDQYYGKYDGTNIDSIGLDGIKDADMQTKVKEGIQQRFKDNVAEIYTMIREKYTPENANAMKLDLQNSYPDKYTQYEIDAAFNQASAVYNNSSMGQAATTEDNVNAIISSFGENGANFDPSKYGNDKQAFINAMIADGKYTKEEAGLAWEQMNSAYESNYQKAYSALLSAGLNSNSTNEAIQTILNNAGINFDDKMIENLRTSLADTEETVKKEEEIQNNAASIAEMDKIDKALNTTQTTQGYLTAYDYMNAYKEVEAYEAENGETEATKAKKAEYREKILAEANGYLSGDDGYNLNEAGGMLAGLLSQDAVDNWDSMSNDARRRAIISAAKGEVDKKSGLVTASELYSMVSSYVTKRVQEIVGTDNSNAKASGLADAGELVNYINSLGITKTEKNKAMEAILRGMSFRIEYNQINWYGSVSGAEASIYGWKEDENKRIFDKEFIDKLESRFKTVSHSGITEYNGKLYGKNMDSNWYEIPTDGITIVGDGHTNTTEQAKGIYDLLVYMLDPNVGKVTVSGSSENGGTKGKGITQGGRTEEFAVANK